MCAEPLNESEKCYYTNPFDKFSNEIERISLPVYNYRSPQNLLEDDMFIGRRDIIDKLKDWIKNGSGRGAYLVTGYRGMGKTSFVDKVIKELENETKVKNDLKKKSITKKFNDKSEKLEKEIDDEIDGITDENTYRSLIFLQLLWSQIKYYLKLLSFYWKRDRQCEMYIPIRINLSHEVLQDRDVLCLVAKNVEETLTTYAKNFLFRKVRKFLILSGIAIVFFYTLYSYLDDIYLSYHSTHEVINKYVYFINYVFYRIRMGYPYLFYPVLFSITLFFLYWIWQKLSLFIHRKTSFSTITGICTDLRCLNDRIEAVVSEEFGITNPVNNELVGGLLRRRKKITQIATVREIEQELRIIFDKLATCRCGRLKLIVIFDELDKIDPVANYEEKGLKDNLPEYDVASSGFVGGATSRSRKYNIFRTLSNMKYFLSTVHVKFIFISGRELYDAFLADVSDREFAISSVFDGVINVTSFLTESTPLSDIIAVIERYVCQRLLPKKYVEKLQQSIPEGNEIYTLCVYHEFLKKKLLGLDADYVIRFLYHFSYYLAHVSNGSPKKIAIYFDKYIRTRDYLKEVKYQKLVKNNVEHYLSFNERHQHKINFVHYIAYPIIRTIISKSNIYGDKYLISTSFMVNHIYKYHSSGFSWRNLEHIPELLEINRTPELRDFLSSIIGFLKQVHIISISSGLYLFKFPLKISEEISFHSKISDEVSALFNFSLDESLSVKKHFANLLRYYSDKSNTGIEGISHSLSSIHHILGDIYMADEDYSQAIFEYQNSLQLLKSQVRDDKYDDDPHWPSHMLFLVRTMLKLGLTYEKRKTFNSAYFAYCELVNKLIDFRYIEESSLGLEYKVMPVKGWEQYQAILKVPEFNTSQKTFEKHVLPEIEKDANNGYNIQSNCLHSQFAYWLTPMKSKILARLSTFEDVRFIYQALLAKLFVLEKIELGGITKSDVDLTESEFFNLHITTDSSEKFMISADFFRNLGDVMFYKNGLVDVKRNNLFYALYFGEFDVNNYIERFCISKLSQRENYQKLKSVLKDFVEWKPCSHEVWYPETRLEDDEGKENCIEEEDQNTIDMDYIENYSKEEIQNRYNEHLRKLHEKYFEKRYKEKAKVLYQEEFNRKYKDIFEREKRRDVQEHLIDKFWKDKREKDRTLIYEFIETLCIDDIHPYKIQQCKNHIDQMLNLGKHLPCHACKYYNRSLKILMDALVPAEYCQGEGRQDFRLSKSIILFKALVKEEMSNKLLSLRENHLVLLGSTLEGLGNVLVSCSNADTNINADFLKDFLDIIVSYNNGERICDQKIEMLASYHLTMLEKAMIYYWCATKFFNSSNNLTMAFRTNKKMLEILWEYIENSNGNVINNVQSAGVLSNTFNKEDVFQDRYRYIKRKQNIRNNLERIRKGIVRRALINIYSHYEYINFVEIKELKKLLEVDGKINLAFLSLFPDIAEIYFVYYSLEIACDKYDHVIDILECPFLASKRLASTLSQNILNLKFKANINRIVLFMLLKVEMDDVVKEYSKNIKVLIPKIMGYLFDGLISRKQPLRGYREKDSINYFKKNSDQELEKVYKNWIEEIKINLKEYFEKKEKEIKREEEVKEYESRISEEKGNIAKKITSFYFSNGDGPKERLLLLEFLIKDSIFCLNTILENVNPHPNITLFTNSFMGDVYKDLCEWEFLAEKLYDVYKEIDSSIDLRGVCGEELWQIDEFQVNCNMLHRDCFKGQERYKQFKKYVEKRFFLKFDYHNEMTLKRYIKAKEMHSEGKAYKEMIINLSFLDDELNNDTCQFQFAIERYRINSGCLDKSLMKRKIVSGQTTIYDTASYLFDN